MPAREAIALGVLPRGGRGKQPTDWLRATCTARPACGSPNSDGGESGGGVRAGDSARLVRAGEGERIVYRGMSSPSSPATCCERQVSATISALPRREWPGERLGNESSALDGGLDGATTIGTNDVARWMPPPLASPAQEESLPASGRSTDAALLQSARVGAKVDAALPLVDCRRCSSRSPYE